MRWPRRGWCLLHHTHELNSIENRVSHFFFVFTRFLHRFSVANDADVISGPGGAVATGENDESSRCSSGSSIGDDAEIDFSPLDALSSAIAGER